MATVSRRLVLEGCAGATVLYSAGVPPSASQEAGPAIGLQLFSLDAELKRDLLGTLRAVHDIGYRRVEAVGYYDLGPADLRKAFDDTGLTCSSMHLRPHQLQGGLPSLAEQPESHMAKCRELGLRYLVVPGPWLPGRVLRNLPQDRTLRDVVTAVSTLTVSDWGESADALNRCAALARAHGLQLLYHNGNLEFVDYDGETGYDRLVRLTDPDLVKLELDCGWVTAAGHDPEKYLREQRGRIPLVHIKDMHATTANTAMKIQPAVLGAGIVDWPRLLEALRSAGVEQAFVEQEAPHTRPPLESADLNYEFLHGLELGRSLAL